jgi:cell division protein FtsI (penicillin-binding protein 3)
VALVDRRIGYLFSFFLVLLLLAAGRAAWFGSIRAPSLQRAAATQQVTNVVVPAERGAIRDRNGVNLAVSEMDTTVAATPYLIKDPLKTARRIAPLLGIDPDLVLRKLTDKRTGFVYLARKLSSGPAERIEKMNIEGLQFIPEAKRVYPRGWLASQLLGTVGTDNTGLSGIEYFRERALHGNDGERRLVKDALGQPISLRDTRKSVPGRDLTLTLDSALETKAEDVLQQVGAKFRPKGATALVMDPRDGSILALANWPRVDANAVQSSPPYARQDRATGITYEPGSTFKAITVAGALQDGTVTPSTKFDLAPQIKIADRIIGEAHARGPETLSTAQILAYSSNVGAITIGGLEGKKRFSQWVTRFGFGKPTGVDLPGEERGQVLPLDKYSGSSMGNLPIGQGISVTPIQMATAYAAIANGGILRPPHVVQSVGDRRLPEPKGHRVVSPATADSLRRMLEGVFAAGGTASEARIPGYRLAGKTGTANKIDPTTGLYSDSRYVASFVGFVPARAPKLLVAVMVDEPQGSIFGGVVAAPAFQEITSFALSYLKIPPG